MLSGENLVNAKKKLIFYVNVMASVTVVAGMLLYFFYDNLFQRPVSGEIKVQPSTKEDLTNAPFERFEGIYFSFHYHPTYHVNFQEKDVAGDKGILERALLSQMGDQFKKIALTVDDMIGRDLTEVASYNLRKKLTARYSESKFVLGGMTGTAFISREENRFEKTIFIGHNKYLIEISFSGPLNSEREMEMEIADIMASIQWKK
ncbi:MAG: hypothetical protein WC823_04950 [Parcubacteria group bacterium]|jgi:hypothetical protein